jgi:hypothetical protein
MDLTKGQHAKLRRERAELQRRGQEYIDAEARVDAHIQALETAELEKDAKFRLFYARTS